MPSEPSTEARSAPEIASLRKTVESVKKSDESSADTRLGLGAAPATDDTDIPQQMTEAKTPKLRLDFWGL